MNNDAIEPKPHKKKEKYPHLNPNGRAKYMQSKFDFDYINKLKEQSKSKDPRISKEALEALTFLDAFCHATFEGYFTQLDEIVKASPEFKKEVFHDRYAAEWDVSNQIPGSMFSYDDTNEEEKLTLGEAKERVEAAALVKKRERRLNRSVLPETTDKKSK